MIEIDDLIIDPEFTNQLSSLYSEAYDVLEADILEKGVVTDSIETWDRIIVDGHRRYDIIQKHSDLNIQYRIHELDLPNRAAALAWMYGKQLGQNKLSTNQQNYLLGKEYELEKQSQGGTGANRYTKKVQTGQNVPSVKQDSHYTAQCIAIEHGLNEKTVRRAEYFAKGVDIAEETVPGTRQEILAGKIKPAYKDVTNLLGVENDEDRKSLIEGFHYEKKKKTDYQELDDLPEYDIEEPVTNVTIQEVEEISARMESSDGQDDEDGVIYELNDALDTLIFRWEKCVETNPEVTEGESYYHRRDEIVKKGLDFLNKFKKRRKKKK